jgi:hypothetical protein
LRSMRYFALVLAFVGIAASAADVRGLYFYGPQLEVFFPCGSTVEYWVTGAPTVLKPLRERVVAQERRGAPVGKPLFIVATGTIDRRARHTGGPSDHYDGVFRVRQVKRVEGEIPANCRDGY